MEWHDLYAAHELAPGQVVVLEFGGEDLLLFRTQFGRCHAVHAYCPHMGNYMPTGLVAGQPVDALLMGNDIRCPFHGWHFDGKGRCTAVPAGQWLPAAARAGRAVLRAWRLRERDGRIQITNVPCDGN